VQAWVTGNYADLVDLRHKSALIYRDGIRDGNGLNCSADVRVTEKYIIVRFGTSRDMVRLYAIEGKLGESPRFHFASFPWRDSANLADGHFPKLHPPPGRPPSRSLEKSLLGRQ